MFKLKAGLLLAACLLAGCVSAALRPFYYHPEFTKQDPLPLLEKMKEIEKQDFDNIRLETIAENDLSSHHLVVIRKAEPLHYHATHDAWALVLKGKGDFLLGEKGEKALALRPGSSVYIPRGMRHKATRRGKTSLAAFVIFTPPYDGKDIVPVEEK